SGHKGQPAQGRGRPGHTGRPTRGEQWNLPRAEREEEEYLKSSTLHNVHYRHLRRGEEGQPAASAHVTVIMSPSGPVTSGARTCHRRQPATRGLLARPHRCQFCRYCGVEIVKGNDSEWYHGRVPS